MQNRQAETLDSFAFPAELPLLRDGASCGTVEVVREGLYLRFRTEVPARTGLWRVWLCGKDGEARLGTLEPSCPRLGTVETGDRRLSLFRRLSIRSLSPLGRLLRCEVRPALEDSGPSATGNAGRSPPGNAGQHTPETYGQSAPENAERPAPDILPRPGGGVLLSWPADGSFPLPELFCFARLDTAQNRERWVFAFDGDGRPVFR